IAQSHLKPEQYLVPSRVSGSPHLSTRQYSRIVESWVASIGLDAAAYGTHSLRRTKATLIYRRTRNLRAVQLLLGRTKLESNVRYLGIESTMHWRSPSRPRCSLVSDRRFRRSLTGPRADIFKTNRPAFAGRVSGRVLDHFSMNGRKCRRVRIIQTLGVTEAAGALAHSSRAVRSLTS